MSFDLERVYKLLPAIYRLRDTQDDEQGGPLKALLAVIAGEVAIIEDNLAQLYDDQFIETCAEWVVPYIGDLLGVRGLHSINNTTFSQRAFVANSIAYRRRKGTAAMLEQLARDVTGWNARVVEFFELLATTQNLNHVRPNNLAMTSLRQWEPLERLNTPFDSIAHTADVRRIANRRGRYNIPNIGVFLWRLNAFSLTESPAFRVDDHRYLFSPLGNNTPLFTLPETEDEISHLAEPINVPMPISRRVLDRYLDNQYYGQNKSLSISIGGKDVVQSTQKPSDHIVVCDLSDVKDASGQLTWAHMPNDKIAVDPVLGRIAFPIDQNPEKIRLSFHYGFSMEMGGGEYERATSFEPEPRQTRQLIQVPEEQPTIQQALNALIGDGVIEITNSEHYKETPTFKLAAGQRIELRAANEHRPTLMLSGDMQIEAEAETELSLNGLLISGGSVRVKGKLRRLRLSHCTLVPGLSLSREGAPEYPDVPSCVLDIEPGEKTEVEIDHSIVGPLRLPAERSELKVYDSIIDSPTRNSRAIYLPALISDSLDPFPTLGTARAIHVTLGSEGPYQTSLPAAPTDLDDASVQLQAAIRAAHTSPAFSSARVLKVEKRLIVLPGAPGLVSIQTAGTDDTATRLGLVHPTARRVYALISGTLPSTLTLRSSTPALQITVGADGPYLAKLISAPNNLDEAREQLQAAIRTAHSNQMFQEALVTRIDSQLVVLPGTEGAALVLSIAPEDPTTLIDLALESDRPAIAASAGGEQPGPLATLERTTIIGAVYVKELTLASDVIFTGQVVSDRRQAGCVRFSYVPEGSQTPRRYYCQPAASSDPARIRPTFTSLRYGDPGYCQLSQSCSVEIWQGASDEAEMGAFHNLYQPQRETNLRVRLDEYLRFALEAGIFYVT